EYLPGLRPNSQRRYREVLDRFERFCKPRTLAGITERTLTAMVDAMGEEGFAAATIRHTLVIIRAALAWADRQRMLARVPEAPAVKVPRKKPQPVPAESIERLLAKSPDQQTTAYLLCGWLAGLRLNEALELEWEPSLDCPWVDLARDRICLPAEFVKAVEDQWVPLDPIL